VTVWLPRAQPTQRDQTAAWRANRTVRFGGPNIYSLCANITTVREPRARMMSHICRVVCGTLHKYHFDSQSKIKRRARQPLPAKGTTPHQINSLSLSQRAESVMDLATFCPWSSFKVLLRCVLVRLHFAQPAPFHLCCAHTHIGLLLSNYSTSSPQVDFNLHRETLSV
jgi:hypothetical protein